MIAFVLAGIAACAASCIIAYVAGRCIAFGLGDLDREDQ